MTIAAIPQPEPERLSLGEIKERVRALSLRENIVISEAVDRVLPAVELDGDAVSALNRLGLISLLNNDESRARSGDDAESWTKSIRSRYQRGYNVQEISAFLMRFETPDGKQLPLLEWLVDDLPALKQTYFAEAAGLVRRGKAVDLVYKEGRKRGAVRVKDIPAAELAQLNPVLKAAWS